MNRVKLVFLSAGLIVVLFGLYRAFFFFYYFDYFSSLSLKEIFVAFLQGAKIDLSINLTFLSLPLLILILPIKLNKKIIGVLIFLEILIVFVLSAVAVGDIFYFGFVKRHLSNELLLIINDVSFLINVVLKQYTLAPILFFTVLFILYKIIFKIPIDEKRPSFLQFLALFVLIFIGIRGTLNDKPINVIDAFNYGAKVGNLSLNGAFTSYHFSRKAGKFSNKKFFSQQEALKILDIKNKEYPFLQHISGKDKKNVVFILMESWSAKYIDSFSHNNYQVTPNFDALAKKSTIFTNFFAAGQRSIEGIQASLTSIPPFPRVPNIGFGLEVYKISKAANIANSLHYQTIFMQSSKRRSFRMDAIAKALGFREYYGWEDMPMIKNYQDSSKFGWDYESYMFLANKLKKTKKPFFAFLFTGTTHMPYAKIKGFNKYPHEKNGENGFLNTLYYSDWAIGEFFKQISHEKWFKKTIFIFTADHTASAFRSGFVDKFRTPLLIFDPSNPKQKIITDVSSQLDLMPTILSFLGFDGFVGAYGKIAPSKRAIVCDSATIGLIKNKGFIRHSLNKILDTNLSKADTNKYEKELLATYQLINESLKNNKYTKGE